MKIEKAKETMSSRERVRRTFDFEKTDRVTIGYEANGLIHQKLLAALGVSDDGLQTALGVDYFGVRRGIRASRFLMKFRGGRLIHWMDFARIGSKTRAAEGTGIFATFHYKKLLMIGS